MIARPGSPDVGQADLALRTASVAVQTPRGSLLPIDSRGVDGGARAVLGGADAVKRFVGGVHAVTEPLDGLEHQLVVIGAAHRRSHDGGLLRGGFGMG